ncbi:transglycosylase SLT domain-containing protein [Streptomyces sp. NPDC020917]|uniref:transglycosylase SLT domain-containing protein n=1 Tax=Streptomyces sp. NPDC020917 TaxID=3365102 RepID=UPI0037B36A72
MAGRSGRPWFAAGAAVLLLGLAATRHGSSTATPEPPQPSGSRTSTPAPAPTRTAASGYDPAGYAAEVRRHARETGIDPQLLMAILYNEAYKPHDPALERAWQRLKPDSAFGIANMHRAAFDDTKKGRPFAGRSWEELPDDPDLAVEAAAWYLHDLARQLPARRTGPYTEDQLLALGYNTGPATMRAFARGATPGSQAGTYLAHLKENWPRAAKALEPGPAKSG